MNQTWVDHLLDLAYYFGSIAGIFFALWAAAEATSPRGKAILVTCAAVTFLGLLKSEIKEVVRQYKS